MEKAEGSFEKPERELGRRGVKEPPAYGEPRNVSGAEYGIVEILKETPRSAFPNGLKTFVTAKQSVYRLESWQILVEAANSSDSPSSRLFPLECVPELYLVVQSYMPSFKVHARCAQRQTSINEAFGKPVAEDLVVWLGYCGAAV